MSVPARLTAALADRYRLERELGQGGMATVYLAEDLKHGRNVAIKVLHPELSAIIGGERFLAEIKTTASLQHPHILGLIDSGDADGLLYYVMPFIEGETLRGRLQREKQLPVEDAVRLAREVAAALEFAHKRGIVHRDIKPENILLQDGQALVADFGIALAVQQAGGSRMTQTGMSLGTPAYMSPEQAMGERDLGPRSDVYALGAMTYEMLAGEPPFTGPNSQAIVAKVLTEHAPPLRAKRPTVPPAVEAAVLTALQKLPADRFASAAQFAEALQRQGAVAMPAATVQIPAAMPPARRARAMAPWLVAAVALGAAAWGWLARPGPAPSPLARFEVRLPQYVTQHLVYSGGTLALSPDGGTIAYVGRSDQGPRFIMVRDRDAVEARRLPGTDYADAPFFSPDGNWVGYFSDGRLMKVALRGGAPIVIADSANVNLPSAVWQEDGTIMFVGPPFDIRVVPENGGAVRVLPIAQTTAGHAFPSTLPGGDAVLLTSCSNNCASMTVLAVELPSGRTHELLSNTARAWFTGDGRLVYVRQDGSVFAERFNPRTFTLDGRPELLVPRVRMSLGVTPELALSTNGTMLHIDPGAVQQIQVVRADRRGTTSPVDPEWRGNFNYVAISPDGRQLAVSVNVAGRTEVWIKQMDRGPFTRLAFEGSVNYRPAWMPDGRTLGFLSDRTSRSLAYQARADGSGPATPLVIADTAEIDELDFSRDGQWLAYRTGTKAGVRRVAVTALPSTAGRAIEPGNFDQYMPVISPDGRWLAYVNVETGREEVYVRPFPNTGDARWQVSTAGGASPQWSHTGRELFYVDAAERMTAVAIAPGAEFRAGEPRALFTLDRAVLAPYHQNFAVSPDDGSFLFLQDPTTADGSSRFATLTLNALAALGGGKAAP